MMKYDFDTIVDRLDTNSVKWDIHPEVIPMWVADMDFKAAPFIMDAVRRRVEHGVFGYTYVPDRYYKSVADWFERRRGWHIEREWVQYISGLVPGLAVAIDALTEPGDKVLFQTPAYNCFFSCALNNGRRVAESPLIYDESGSQPTFRMDFDDLERKCSDPEVKLFILCNPQNPAGRVWTPEELRRVGLICRGHGIPVVSDEIHYELEMPGHRYTPFVTVCPEDRPVTFCSPSKSFNIAGLEIANIISADPEKMERIRRSQRKFEQCDLNPIGVDALIAAYSPEGEEWLRQLNSYLWNNYLTLKEMFEKSCPFVKVCALEGTYLVWMDCKAFTAKGITTQEIQDSLIEVERVWINSGTMYGDGDFMRINIACPHATLVEGIGRVSAGLERIWSRGL